MVYFLDQTKVVRMEKEQTLICTVILYQTPLGKVGETAGTSGEGDGDSS